MFPNSHQHHPSSMPPPPMPASLDPTTISSTKSSISTNQYSDSSSTTLIPPPISPLTSFANLSLLSPALLRSTPPPSLSVSFTRPPPNPGMTTVPLSRESNTTTWSPLRRHTAALSSTSPSPHPASGSLSSYHNDNHFLISSPSSLLPPTIIPTNDVVGQPVESRSCTPSPPPSPSSPHPEIFFMDTNNEVQSTPHSPDPTWRADSPSGDHVNSGLDIPVHVLNHDGICELQSEASVTDTVEVQQGPSMNEDGHCDSPVIDVNGGDHGDVGVSSAFRVHQSDTSMVVDHFGRVEEKSLLTDTPEHMSGSNQSFPPNDVPSSEPKRKRSPLPLLPNLVSLSPSQSQYQPALNEEGSRPRERQPSDPPAPKVKMSLRDFALRKKKLREEEEMTKSVKNTPSAGEVNLPSIRSEGGAGPNEIQVNQVGPANGESSNGKLGVDGINRVGVKAVDLEEGDLMDGLGKDSLYQSASTLSVKKEVVDEPGTSSIKPAATNGYHSSPPPHPVPASIQAGSSSTFTYPTPTRQSKQELIEQPIPTVTTQPMIMDSTRYAAMYNNSGSISPINPDPHHFQSQSPPRSCQEDGEIGENMDMLRLPSSSLTSLPAAPPAMNRLSSSTTAIPSSSSITPLPRGPITKRADSALIRSLSSSSQVRHSPPTHPRSFNASPPYRQPPSVLTPAPARGTGVPPPTAPRALRQYMLSNPPTPTTPTCMTSSSYPSTTSSTSSSTATPVSSIAIATTGGRLAPYIPRGPADRERGWDMDQTHYARSLSRNSKEGGHSWGGR